jgi:hypothetical protein
MQGKFKKISLFVSIIFFLLLCLSLFFIFKEIEKNVSSSKESQIALQKEILRRDEIRSFNESFKLIEKEKNLLETHFAQSSDIVPFLNKIETMANSVDTKVEVSFIEVAKDGSGLVLEMKDIGGFLQVYKFLTLLENSPYELEFTSVDLHNITTSYVDKNKKNIEKSEWEAILKIKLISFI